MGEKDKNKNKKGKIRYMIRLTERIDVRLLSF